MSYANTKRWRDKNPKKVQEFREKYYKKPQRVEKEGLDWTAEEIKLIMSKTDLSDRELSEQLGRSVLSIQVRRSKEKKRRSQEASNAA